jgi:hypothetical protein
MSIRDTTMAVIDSMIKAGDKNGFPEPIGVVLLYPDQAFLKAVWTDGANRSDIAQGLIMAATDELSKA